MFDQAAKRNLLEWYRERHRDLPWRYTRDPYRILVSEVMLQQTQADRVIPKYHEFLQRFPTLRALADAPTSEVIRAWSGLGYNRRALNLQRACRAVVERFDGVMPTSVEELATLPGVGPYTAGAIACFAFEADVGFVDTNIRRVLHRVVAGPDVPTQSLSVRQIQDLAAELVPAGEGYDWNQALMELGATLCRARSVICEACPLKGTCVARPLMADLLTSASRSNGKTAERFETSSRYYRGRIVEALRQAHRGLTLPEIGEAAFGGLPLIDPDLIAGYVAGLERDGLVVALQAAPSLHEDHTAYDRISIDDQQRYGLPD